MNIRDANATCSMLLMLVKFNIISYDEFHKLVDELQVRVFGVGGYYSEPSKET